MPSSLLQTARNWLRSKHKMAIAIVLKTWGSAPRSTGSFMLVREDMHVEGSVSGGCVEADVIGSAKKAMETNQAFMHNFGISNENAWQVGLSCGGEIRILVIPVTEKIFPLDVLERICNSHEKRDSIDVILTFDTETQFHVSCHIPTKEESIQRNSLYEKNKFIWRFRPSWNLVIVGAGHISQKLAQLANILELAVNIVDPRSMFANNDRFPNVDIHVGWPQKILPKLHIDSQTALVTLTHDPKIDDPALSYALKTQAFYIGALGSRLSHEARCRRLKEGGSTNITRIHGPAGLPLGGRHTSEIALSIMAEIVSKQYQQTKKALLPT